MNEGRGVWYVFDTKHTRDERINFIICRSCLLFTQVRSAAFSDVSRSKWGGVKRLTLTEHFFTFFELKNLFLELDPECLVWRGVLL